MNTNLLDKNLTLFSKRFEHLYVALKNLQSTYQTPKNIALIEAKNGEISAMYEKQYMHSAYNPTGEAQKFLSTTEVNAADSIVFLGIGLGYGPIECAQQHKNKTIIIIEPNAEHVLLSFSILDWTALLEHQSIVFLLEAPQQTVIAVLEQYGLKECFFIAQKSIMLHAQEYFTAIQTLIERNIDKQNINMKTLERFSTLWLSNMCKNFPHIVNLDGIQRFADKANNLAACVIAAGPSLDEVLPHLHEIKKRCILICVDTALRACLSAGVQPHFIILVDPQYWNARHIDGLKSPESILITESAAYPSVFRFECKEIVLCSSLFPLGKYIEKFTGNKGELAAGGSVATSAWDFARLIGCKEIFMAGLDLSYPGKKTHTKGSTFEEKSHIDSKKISQTETALAKVLYNPLTEKALDYDNNETITDARMKLYAWWFESKCVAFNDIKTFTLSKKSIKIPNITVTSVQELLKNRVVTNSIEDFVNMKKTICENISYEKILSSLTGEFSILQDTVNKGIGICNKHYKNEAEYKNAIETLNTIDSAIYSSEAKNIVSLVFPTPEIFSRILKEKIPNAPPPPPQGTYTQAAQYNIQKTKVLYELIKKSLDMHIRYLRKNA